jgi:hypothetical protein
MSVLLEYVAPAGTVWDLRTGPVRMAPGAQGLGLLSLTDFTTSRGPRGGQRRTGWSVNPQDLVLPMKAGYPGWTARTWDDVDEAWWKDVRPHLDGAILRATYSVGALVKSVREVPVRTKNDGPFQWDQDPSDVETIDFDWNLIADVPWWLGPKQSTPFGITAAGQPFYGAGGYGPPFYISAGNSNGSQSITNPGDVPAWPVWTLNGPIPAFTITHADGSTISGTPNLAVGERLVIDTTEDEKSATRIAADGSTSDFTPSLASWGWRAIPAGTSTTIGVAISGTGGATAEIRPRYFRPFH